MAMAKTAGPGIVARIVRVAALGLAAGLGPARRGAADEAPPAERPPNVVDVRVQGNQTVATERILSTVTTHANRPYYEDQVKDDINRLYETRWFYDVKADIQQSPNGVVVVFRVYERPVIQEVKFVGNTSRKFSAKKLQDLTGLRAGKSMDPGLNRVAARQIEREYHEKGWPFASVELLEGGTPGDKRVEMRIDEGPKTKISSIQFEGNTFVGQARLKTLLDNKEAWGSLIGWPVFLGKYDGQGIEQDRIKLIEYYRGHGYLDVRVGRELSWSDDRKQVGVKYIVNEGPRYKVRNVQFTGNKAFATDNLQSKLQLVSGKTLSRDGLEKDMNLIREEYGSQGYIHAAVNVEQRYTDTPGEVDLYYQVVEDLPRKIGRINIEGNEITQRRVILNILDLEPGQLADSTEIRKAQQRLMSARLFEVNPQSGIQPVVEFDPASDPTSEFQDIRVRVQEAQTGQLMLGAGVNSNSGFGGSLVINERNFDLFAIPLSWSDIREGRAFRGAGQDLRIEAIPGNLVHRYSVTFREPRFLGTDISFATSGYYYRRIFQAWTEQRLGGRFSLGRQFSRTIGGNVTYRIEGIDVTNPSVPTPQDLQEVLGDNFLQSFRFAGIHDTRDSALRPSEGHYVEAGFEQAFGDFTFPRFSVEGRQYWTIHQRADGSGKHILAARAEFGWSGDDTPIFERFYAGGFNSIRGFQFRGVSPVDLGVEVGGNFILLGGLEYQFPLTADDTFGGALFVDSGTVERELEVLDYRVSVGFGIRIAIPMLGPVPLAFDFGFPVVDTNFDDKQIFSFSVGWFN